MICKWPLLIIIQSDQYKSILIPDLFADLEPEPSLQKLIENGYPFMLLVCEWNHLYDQFVSNSLIFSLAKNDNFACANLSNLANVLTYDVIGALYFFFPEYNEFQCPFLVNWSLDVLCGCLICSLIYRVFFLRVEEQSAKD